MRPPPATSPQMGVLHRDIKPENFILSCEGSAGIVKLADFGLSTFFRQGECEKEAVGSPFFMAPEMLTGTGYGAQGGKGAIRV